VGFLVADALASSSGVSFHPGKGKYWLAQCSLNNIPVSLVKPVTFMNMSGVAVQEFLDHNEISLNNILIICDDFQLPLGTIRLRSNGSDGGHHGLASVIFHLQTDQFARLRCGIGTAAILSEKSKMKDFVLEQFSGSELPSVKSMIERAHDACTTFVREGIEQAMNRFNTK
jgi:PTH1 family peptidyl-tRNA hydrolase